MGKETWARRLGSGTSPSPDQFDTRQSPGQESPRFTIKKKHGEKNRACDAPYRDIRASVGSDAPKFTMRPRYEERDTEQSMGPSYVPPPFGSDAWKTGTATIGPRGRIDLRRKKLYESHDQNPHGPAEFDARRNPKDARAPAYSIAPHIGDSWMKKNSNPASNAYDPDHFCGKRAPPKWVIGEKVEFDRSEDVPGPGTYNVPMPFGKARRASVGEVRHRSMSNDVPGPGSYEIQKPMGRDARSASIRQRQKSRLRRNDGEYKYNVKREFDQPSGRKTIAPKTNGDLRRDATPGPGYYEQDGRRSARTHGLGPRNGKRSEPSWIPKSDTPSPCAYHIERKESGASFTLHEGHGNFGGETIGPGPKYNPDNDRVGKRSPRFTMRPRTTGGEPKSATQDAGYLVMPPNSVPPIYIHRKEHLGLIPE